MKDLGHHRCVCPNCGARHRKRASTDPERAAIAQAAARARWGSHVPARPRKLKKQVYKPRIDRSAPARELYVPAPEPGPVLRWDSRLNRMVLE